jgi:hypothetical protein
MLMFMAKRSNEQRLSDAGSTLIEVACAAWRQRSLVELNRRDGGDMGSVSSRVVSLGPWVHDRSAGSAR